MRFRSSVWMRAYALAGALVLCGSLGGFASAQQAAAAEDKPQSQMTAADFPQTPQERMKRYDLSEDPGLDPDPGKIFMRYGKKYQIQKFEERREWGVSDLARAAGMDKAMTHRILRALLREQWVVQNLQTRLYSLGPALRDIASLQQSRTDVLKAAEPVSTSSTMIERDVADATAVWITGQVSLP